MIHNKKKYFFILSFFVFLFSLPAELYKIQDVEFSIEGAGFKFLGKTKEYSILTQFPIDKKTEFESYVQLQSYIKDYQTKLESSRAFEYVNIDFETSYSDDSDINNVILKIKLIDSHHLLVVPYGKYSSNTGLSLKLKAKDTNFLGSLNTLSSDISLSFSDDGFIPGLTFSYDNPFKLSIFDAEWINDYTVSYSIADESPEWNLKTGLKLSLPFDKHSLIMEFYQYFYKEIDYRIFDDETYFAEEVALSVPITVKNLKNYTKLLYTPKVSLQFNWDFDGISKTNSYLSSPTVTIGHSLSNENILWSDFFRNGYSFKLTNNFIYNFQRQDLSPYVELEGKYFKTLYLYDQTYWDKYGINIDFYSFAYFDMPFNSFYYGNLIGSRLRGILDHSYFGNNDPLYSSSAAMVLNIDLPHHIFTTDFSKKIFNFDLQFSPFLDIALIYDRNTNRIFSFEDGSYCAGLEFLVYPLKWSSYTIRASLGIDLKESLKEKNVLEAISKHKELFIGIGLHY